MYKRSFQTSGGDPGCNIAKQQVTSEQRDEVSERSYPTGRKMYQQDLVD